MNSKAAGIIVGAKISLDLETKLERVAKDADRTKSYLIRKALEEYLAQYPETA